MSRICMKLQRLVAIVGLLFAASLAPFPVLAQVPGLVQPHQQFEAAMGRGDLAAAMEYGRQALAVAEEQFGADSVQLVDTLEKLGEVAASNGTIDDATGYYRRAFDIQAAELGDLHPALVSTLDALVDVALLENDYDEAERLLRQILEIEEANFGESHENVLITWGRLRDVYALAGRDDDVAEAGREIERRSMATRDLDPGRYETEDGFATVRVFYGTNRLPSGESKPAEYYGNERGELDLGYVDVTIPETHRYGELETASGWSIFTYALGEEALRRRYVLLQKVEPLGQDNFYRRVREYVAESPGQDIFLFVHGYNSSFEDAALRTAQLAYDLDFDGTPMFYAWPSQASTMSYTVDEAVVRLSGRMLARMLDRIIAEAGADRIHLIAHSMGNRALIEALGAVSSSESDAGGDALFGQVVFTAPDVDRDYFAEVVPGLQPLADRFTLYASDSDVALRTSAILHGNPRAGLAGETIVTLDGIDTIDMSEVDADLLGHGYFAANGGAIYDLFRLLWRNDPPDRRCGMRGGEAVWAFDVDTCKGPDILEAGMLYKRFGQAAPERVQQHLQALPEDDDQRDEWLRILQQLEVLLESQD